MKNNISVALLAIGLLIYFGVALHYIGKLSHEIKVQIYQNYNVPLE